MTTERTTYGELDQQNNADSVCKQARYHIAQDNTEKAIEILTKGALRFPDSFRVWKLYALRLAYAKRHAEAAEAVKHILGMADLLTAERVEFDEFLTKQNAKANAANSQNGSVQ